MIVFKTFLKVLNKCKVPIIIYTVILICFGAFNMETSDKSMNFVATKPDVLIINQDIEEGITKNLIQYFEKNCNIKDIKNDEQDIKDALFYRDVNYIIYIPENYRDDFLNGQNPEIKVKSTGDYQSSLAEMILERYLKVANIYINNNSSENDLIEKINDILEKQTDVEITSKLDTNNLKKATFYYNFTNYSILAGCVYVICLILSSFREEKLAKRTVVSSMNYRDFNIKLLLSNCLFAVVLWGFYVIVSFILIGNIMFTFNGLLYIVNSLVFTICAVTIAFFIGNLVNNKNTINGIVNVVALGSSFLCGAFVPMEWLPDFVLKIAHILPSFYFINNNELITELELISFESISPLIYNVIAILIFSIVFVILSNIVSKNKRRIFLP